MRLITGTLILAFLAGPPVAADAAERETQAAPKVRITKKDCRRVIRHQARADVAYKPGVDVRGKPVVPADIGGGFTIPLPNVFEFNITKDLTAYLGGAEDQLAADKAAALAAEKTVAATDAAVSSAELSVAGAQTAFDTATTAVTTAETAVTNAQAAADADPTNRALETALETAQADLTTAQATQASAQTALTTAQTAQTAAETAAATGDYSTALTQSQAALTAAQSAGYTQDATAQTASTTASETATAAASADAAALEAADKVAKSEGMTLNVGTIRYNIKTGAMTFNGKPLNAASMDEMAVLCQEMMDAKKRE